MSPLPSECYSRWRQQAVVEPALREVAASPPPERFLQQVWLHQRLLRNGLRTTDGRALRVLHPGFWNHEAGPDFHQTVLQFDTDPPRQGDVEIDLQPTGWRGHGHDNNPAYKNVILHAVWEARGKSAEGVPPTLELAPVLDAPVAEIAAWLGIGEGEPVGMAGRCAGPLKDLPAETREDLLRQAAQVRLQRKAAQFVARARQAGWEQALWEGLFAALGYKHNAWPMRCLAELIPRLENETAAPEPLARWQSRLLGLSGLLPFEWERSAGTNDYWRALWDIWWREREELAAALLPGNLWRLHGIRPANHPQRRLALAAAWIARDDLPDQLERWLDQSAGEKEQAETLLKVLNMPAGEFWASHWTFRSRPMPAPQPLLGVQRVTDLAVNVVLPWFWSRAMAGKNDAVRQRVERAYFSWPAGEDNAVLKLARHRLLGGVTAKLPKTAAIQQGLIQITRDFCDHADATCAGCRFPELVRQIGG